MPGKRTRMFARKPIRDGMRKVGAKYVTHDALDALISHLENRVEAITEKAMQMSEHAKRSKVMKRDVMLAIEYV